MFLISDSFEVPTRSSDPLRSLSGNESRSRKSNGLTTVIFMEGGSRQQPGIKDERFWFADVDPFEIRVGGVEEIVNFPCNYTRQSEDGGTLRFEPLVPNGFSRPRRGLASPVGGQISCGERFHQIVVKLQREG